MLLYPFSQDNKIQHKTRVENESKDVLLIKITGAPGITIDDKKVKPGDTVNMGTTKGKIGITVYKADNTDLYEARMELSSNINVLVKEDDGKLQIVPVKKAKSFKVKK